jgi:hypothetical protein
MMGILRDGAEYAEQQAVEQREKAARMEAEFGQSKLRLVKAA